jgi:hypothetical protein
MDKVIVDLTGLFAGHGIQGHEKGPEYGFNVWSNTFPAEDLPAPGSVVEVTGIPFAFPATTESGDNIRCRGQYVPVPPGDYDWIYLLGGAERRTEDEAELLYADGTVRRSWLRMSDFWPETPAWFGEPLAFRCSSLRYPRHTQAGHAPAIWQQRIAVTVADDLVGVRLPDNPAMHVFALTAVRDQEARDAR